MYAVFYIQHCGNIEVDFDQVFRFYRQICFICLNKEQLEQVKKEFLKWLETHEFPIDYSFNLIEDMDQHQHPWIFIH